MGGITFKKATFLLPVTFFLLPCGVTAKNQPPPDRAWVIIKPLQCLGNPWEKEWVASHPKQGPRYPSRKDAEVIKSFFDRKGIPIHELRIQRYVKGDPLCMTCDCPRGDTLYLLINAQHAPKMVRLGYTERVPAELVPKKK